MSWCGISNPTSVAILSHTPWRRHLYIITAPSEKNVHFVLNTPQLETLKLCFWKGSAALTMHSRDELWTVSMAWVRARSWKPLAFNAAQYWSPQAELRALTTQRLIRVSFAVCLVFLFCVCKDLRQPLSWWLQHLHPCLPVGHVTCCINHTRMG